MEHILSALITIKLNTNKDAYEVEFDNIVAARACLDAMARANNAEETIEAMTDDYNY